MAVKKTTTKPPLTDEEKKELKRGNFLRVLPRRMDKALKAIRMVGDCTLPTYLYTETQAQAIMNKLTSAVHEVRDRFAGVQGKSGGFKLPD